MNLSDFKMASRKNMGGGKKKESELTIEFGKKIKKIAQLLGKKTASWFPKW